jgi:hypothetical protein
MRMRVKPNAGLQVRDPETKQFIPPEGIEVSEYDLYWVTRLRDQDVVLVTEQVATTKTKSASPTE